MRMRKKKHGSERLDACREFLLENIEDEIKSPESFFKPDSKGAFLEIGAGKGGFAIEMARRNPEISYYAMEKVTDCVVLAAEAAKKCFGNDGSNLRFLINTADNLTKLFANGSFDRIFLNFSDPWSKKGYAKRRLTHRRYLAVYFNILRDGGKLSFKTDNDALFDFSLEEISAMGLTPSVITRDLHSSPYNEGNVMTEYETAFSEKGKNINMLEIIKPCGFSPEIPDDLKKNRRTYFDGTQKYDK